MPYYVIDENKCLHESMTKEQTLAAITDAVESHEISDVNTGFVTTLKEKNGGRGVTVWVGSSAEYAQIALKKQNCLYIITDDEGSNDYAAFLDKINKTLWTGAAQAGNDTYLTVPGIENYSLVAFLVSDSTSVLTNAYWIVAKPYTMPSGVLKYDEVKRSWFKTFGLLAYYGESGNADKLHLDILKVAATDQSIYAAASDAYLLKIVGIM